MLSEAGVLKNTESSLKLAQVLLGMFNIIKHMLVAFFIHDVIFLSIERLFPLIALFVLLKLKRLCPHLEASSNLIFIIFIGAVLTEIRLHQMFGS